jgi:very-short-patch-repair endonuclease
VSSATRSSTRCTAPISSGGLEVDFCWPEHRLVVETDSRTFHRTARAFDNDPRRDRALTLAGWRVVRFRWSDVFGTPELVVAQLRALLELE